MSLIKFNTALIAFTATLGLSLGIISTSFADNPYALYINSANKKYDQDQVQISDTSPERPKSSKQKICNTLTQGKDDFINQMGANTDNNSETLNNEASEQQLLDKKQLLQNEASDCLSS